MHQIFRVELPKSKTFPGQPCPCGGAPGCNSQSRRRRRNFSLPPCGGAPGCNSQSRRRRRNFSLPPCGGAPGCNSQSRRRRRNFSLPPCGGGPGWGVGGSTRCPFPSRSVVVTGSARNQAMQASPKWPKRALSTIGLIHKLRHAQQADSRIGSWRIPAVYCLAAASAATVPCNAAPPDREVLAARLMVGVVLGVAAAAPDSAGVTPPSRYAFNCRSLGID